MTDRYCIIECTECKYRSKDAGTCVYEYDPDKYLPEYRWSGEGAPPRRWKASDGTVVYRSFADYCD